MKKIKLILLITLLVMLITGCQGNAESTTSKNVTKETESTSIDDSVEEDITSFISDFYNAVIINDREFVASSIENGFPEQTPEQIAKDLIAIFFEASIKKAEILVNEIEIIEREGEKYIVVNFSEKLTMENGKSESKKENWNLVEYKNTYKMLYKGYTGSTTDVLSSPFVSNDNAPLDYVKIYDYLNYTKLDIGITNKYGIDLGLGLTTSEYDIVIEWKDGTKKSTNISETINMPIDKSIELEYILDIPYDGFMDNIQYIYFTGVNSPTNEGESAEILIYSAGDNEELFIEKEGTFNL